MRSLITTVFLIFNFVVAAQQTVGLFTNEADAFNGYTLLSPIHGKTSFLLDNCGFIVHTWSSNFILAESAYFLENGDLLRTAKVNNAHFQSGGNGGRLEQFNWEGDLIWEYNISNNERVFHHDVAVMPNGNILTILWQQKTIEECLQAGRDSLTLTDKALWDEVILELKPIGNNDAEIVWEWHLWDHLVQDLDEEKDNFGDVDLSPELLNINFLGATNGPGNQADWVHLNAIDYNEELDQIMINSRSMSELWIIDHSTTTAEAATHSGGNSGKGGDFLYRWGNPQVYDQGTIDDQQLFRQHDAHWISKGLPNEGDILVFNNGKDRPDGTSYSSVDRIAPSIDTDGNYELNLDNTFAPTSPSWSYSIYPDVDFFASFISGAQQLPNGNVLICEGPDGRIFEINSDFEIVWEYINPVKDGFPLPQGNSIFNNDLFRAYRYAPNHPWLATQDLEPINPVELSPLPSDCVLFVDSTLSRLL